jgi:hypothetical protein
MNFQDSATPVMEGIINLHHDLMFFITFILFLIIVRAINTITKKKINVIKNIKSWCKFIIPSITGVAESWKFICQGVEESSKKINIKINLNNKNKKNVLPTLKKTINTGNTSEMKSRFNNIFLCL